MLRRKRIMALLSTTMIFNSFNNVLTPFLPIATEVVKNNNNEMVFKTNEFGIVEHPIITQFEKDRIKFEKKKAKEEESKKQKELEEQKKNEPLWQEFVLTFYSSSISENSKAGAVTCQGKRLQPYMIANNVYSLGTQIYLDGYGTKIVSDRGSNKHFNTSNRLDVYVEKELNESYSQYLKRVNGYGVKKVRGYIVK